MTLAITAEELLTPSENIVSPVVLIEDGLISSIGSRTSVEIPPSAKLMDFPGAVLAPGFIDLHIHGSAGYDVMEGCDKGLHTMAAFLARHGVTSFLATTVTADLGVLVDAVEKIAEQIHRWSPDSAAAAPIGIHLEGPCISRLRRGVHPEAYIQKPTPELFERILKASAGTLRLITIAPELPGAIEVIREAVKNGVKVSIGHTDGTADDAITAIEAGATHATHAFNAMRPFNHRDPGVLGKILESSALSAEIIADGLHVDPLVVNLFLRCKAPQDAVLVTDAVSATGMPDGKYKLGSFEVTVRGLRCEREGRLAGSVLTLDRAVQNVMQFSNWKLAQSIRLATDNPARVVGENCRGSLRVGGRADMVVLSPRGEVINSFAGGRPAIT